MVRKIELHSKLIEQETEIEDLEDQLEEANQRAKRLAAEVDAHETRERERMRAEHAQQQAERREAEQAEIEARIDSFLDGKIPLSPRADVRYERQAMNGRRGDIVLKVELPITEAEFEALQAHLQPAPKLQYHFRLPYFDASAIRRMWADTVFP